MVARGKEVVTGEYRYLAHSVAQRGTRNVHCRVARADDVELLAKTVNIGVGEVVDRIMHISERLALDAQRVRSPYAYAYEHSLVAVAEQVVYRDAAADHCVRADLNA